jgi:hypothetical protein
VLLPRDDSAYPRRRGLELIDGRFNRVNGGSFPITATHKPAPIAPQRVLIDWFVAQEGRIGLNTPGAFRRFEERVFQHRTDLVELILTLRAEGASVMGYGAQQRGTSFFSFVGLPRATSKRSPK